MNATLTALGIALVLALLTALVGPFFVDWTAYSGLFEERARTALGLPLTVNGDVEARLLPSPYVRLRDVVIGEGDFSRLEIADLQLRLDLAPLLKGEFSVRELRLDAPRLVLTIDADGKPVLPTVKATAPTDPDSVALGRVEIVNGAATVLDKLTGAHHVIDRINGGGDAVSLRGPVKLEGGFQIDGAPYSLRLGTGRLSDTQSARIKLEVEPGAEPRLIELDGTVSFAGDQPRYEGALIYSRPPVAATSADAATVDTWRLQSRIRAAARRVDVEAFDFQYGPDERALKVAGEGTIHLGAEPRFEAKATSRQLDFDRALRSGDAPPSSPLETLRRLGDRMGVGTFPSLSGKARLDLSGVVIAGDIVQDIGADLEVAGKEWRIGEARARLPGSTDLRGSGRLTLDPAAHYRGRIDLASGELSGLLHWLGGGGDRPRPKTAIRKLALSGEVDAASGALSVDNAVLRADDAEARGKVSWRAAEAASPPKFAAELTAKALRLDEGTLDALAALRGGSGPIGVLNGADLSLKLEVGALDIRGVTAREFAVDLDAGSEVIDVRRFDATDLAGAKISAKGRIGLDPKTPAARLDARMQAAQLDGAARVLRQMLGAQPLIDSFASRADALSPADLSLSLSTESGGGQISLTGSAGGTIVDLSGRATGTGRGDTVEARGTLETATGARLLAQLGLPVAADAAKQPGRLKFEARGPADGDLKLTATGTALGFDLGARGVFSIAGDHVGTADIGITLAGRDGGALLTGLWGVPAAGAAVPLRLAGELIRTGSELVLTNIDGRIADGAVRGRVVLKGPTRSEVEGALAFDRLSLESVAGIVLGPGAIADSGGSGWPSGAFSPSLVTGLTGAIAVEAGRLRLPGGMEARRARFQLAMRPDGIGLDQLSADLAGGRLGGSAGIVRIGAEARLDVHAKLDGALLSELAWRRSGQAVAIGKLDLSADLEGTGRSLSAIVTALTGGGTLRVSAAELRGIEPAAFDFILRAADGGLALEAPKVRDLFEAHLGAGPLAIDEITGAFTVTSGVFRAGSLVIASPRAAVTGSVTFDLARGNLDAGMVLAPKNWTDTANVGPPQVGISFEGPIAAPKREIDVGALTGFLTMRSVDREMRRIQELEDEIREKERLNRELRMQAEQRARRAAEEMQRLVAQRADEERRRKADEERRREEERRQREAVPPAQPVQPAPPPAPTQGAATPSAPPPENVQAERPARASSVQPQRTASEAVPGTDFATVPDVAAPIVAPAPPPAAPGRPRVPAASAARAPVVGQPVPLAPPVQPAPERRRFFDFLRNRSASPPAPPPPRPLN